MNKRIGSVLLACAMILSITLSAYIAVENTMSRVLGDPINDPRPNSIPLGDPIDDPKPNLLGDPIDDPKPNLRLCMADPIDDPRPG